MRASCLMMLAALTLSGCGVDLSSACENKAKVEATSPDGRYVATAYERDCGATTEFSTVVSLRESSAAPQAEVPGVFVAEGRQAVTLRWEGGRRLRVGCDGCGREIIFRREKSWEGVEIVY